MVCVLDQGIRYNVTNNIIYWLSWMQIFVTREAIWQWFLRVISSLLMMTSSNGNIFRVTGPLCGEFTGPGEFPAQRPVTRSFDVFFVLHPNTRLSKQPWGWWFETLSWSLWRHCNVKIIAESLHSPPKVGIHSIIYTFFYDTLLAKKVVTPRDDVSFLWLFLFHQSARSKDRLFGVI